MEKELPPPDSMASVTIKPDYAPSEAYSSEPPPAYQRPKSAAVQVAKIIAVTVVLVSMVLGGCILASAYITANASCRHLEQELQLLTESMDRYQPLQPEALVQEEPQEKRTAEPLAAEETKATKAVEQNSVSQDSDSQDSSEENSDSNSSEEEDERIPIQIKLPLQLDFDDLAGAMMEKNQRSKMNCVVEKKRAEEVVDHQPKTVNLPFGVNITTDPRYEKVSGERIAIFCESGNFQRTEPQDQEETIMIQPVMIPLPPPQFHTHMPMQAQPQPQPQAQQMHPMETMRPPMPNQMIQMQLIQQQIQQRQQYLQQQHLQQQQLQQQQLQQQELQQQQQQQEEEQQQRQPQMTHLPPSQILHHIAQQIIAQKLQQEAERAHEEVQSNELRPDQEQNTRTVKVQQRLTRIPLPEDILTQIDRLPNRDVIVAVSHHQPEEVEVEDDRQSYARGIPVNIPVPMMEQEQDSSSSKETRENYVHPRSIRSVEDLVPKSQKRVKRCNCECAC